jgi:FMN phosphatase YigB (HAD superfamily)
MSSLEVTVDEALLHKARQYADEHGTTLEALLAEHLSELADRAGRRLTVREQTYVDYRPPEEVVEALRTEGSGAKG